MAGIFTKRSGLDRYPFYAHFLTISKTRSAPIPFLAVNDLLWIPNERWAVQATPTSLTRFLPAKSDKHYTLRLISTAVYLVYLVH
jgi:hypothetical protein